MTPKKVDVQVFRLPSIDAAVGAFQTIRTWNWATVAQEGQVRTGDLRRVVQADLPLEHNNGGLWLALPTALPAGWYVVEVESPARPIQAVLQVSDVSAYVSISTTNTVVWANNVRTDRPIANAVVSSGASPLGRTGSDGLLVARTPNELLVDRPETCASACPPVLTVTTGDGNSTILPAITPSGPGFLESSWTEAPSQRYWSVFNTDRTRFRPTDSINAWGLLRDRESGKSPASAVIRLAAENEGRVFGPAVTSINVELGPTGAFAGSIPVKALPVGRYSLAVVVGDEVVETLPIEIGQILKPAYRIELTTGHRVYIAGDRIHLTGRASFFDGTPVPGLPLRLTEFIEEEATTDADGRVEIRTVAKVDPDNSGYAEYRTVYASPRGPEEGEIAGGSRDFVVFPSSRLIDATAEIRDGRVRVSGDVHLVDQERLNTEIGVNGSVWDLDPRGAVVDGAQVKVRFIEQVPVRGEGHQAYDFVEKKVVTIYDFSVTERDAGSVTVRSDDDGAFSASIPADEEGHTYEIRLSTTDADGHVARQSAGAYVERSQDDNVGSAMLAPTDRNADFSRPYGIGESIDLTMVEPSARTEVRSFLFFDAHLGIRSAAVQTSPQFVAKFTEAHAPDTNILGVRFNGAGYDVAPPYRVSFRGADRELQVQLSTASSHHKPGDQVTVDARVRDASGDPVASAVIVRVVDEKLFTAGYAAEVDALEALYRSVGSGIMSTYATHRLPLGESGGGDTTGGGGDRSDFQDALLFRMIETGPDGRGSVSFTLSDDLTSWRVIGTALTGKLEAGTGSLQVPVGLPFFVEATIAPEYLAADRPSIVVRTFGEALEAGDRVSITVEIEVTGSQHRTAGGNRVHAARRPASRTASRPARDHDSSHIGNGLGGDGRRHETDDHRRRIPIDHLDQPVRGGRRLDESVRWPGADDRRRIRCRCGPLRAPADEPGGKRRRTARYLPRRVKRGHHPHRPVCAPARHRVARRLHA